MRKFRLKILVLAFVAFTVILVSNLALYNIVDASNSIFLKVLFFAVIYAVFVYLFYYLFKIVDDKYNDVQTSRRYYYYTKPFILKIDNNGNILKYNKTVEEKVLHYADYTSVYNFEVEVADFDLLDDVLRQKPFTTKFQSHTFETIYVRFLPVKVRNGFYLIGEDTTEQHNINTFHKNMAMYNEITKLPNKNYLGVKLQELFNDEEALKKNNSLVSFDIIGFSNINKLFGLKIGDETLRTFRDMVLESLEKYNATLYNIELDNFIVLFLNQNKYQDVIDWVEAFSGKFDKAIEVAGNMFTISVRAGIFNIENALYDHLNPVESFENVQLALRRAKESRRLNYAVYDLTFGKHFSRAQLMEVDLASALKKNEFVINLQPQYNNVSNKVVGFEALIRWNNPKYAYESPTTFIEIAERNNFIVDIGRYVIEESFKIAKELEPYNIKISINVSPVQLLQAGFVQDFIRNFRKYDLKIGSICIEITETFLMESLNEIVDKLSALRRHGVIIHLDNFGTGYSSMLYLKDLPIDGISINKEFIKNLNTDKYSRNIVSQIIKLAQSLDLKVIAEGVEDQEQNAFLKEKGCNVIQGFLISKALPKEEAVKFIKEKNRDYSQNTSYNY